MTSKPDVPYQADWLQEKIIWILWFSGLESAPSLIKKCVASWYRWNPGWDIRFLDESNLARYVDAQSVIARNSGYIAAQARANVVRMHLLDTYGGVWVDATTYCMKPLDEWLPQCMISGFFAFRDPEPDRVLSNWFLAAKRGSYIIKI